MPRILYIAHNGLADPLGQSQILPYVRQLSQLGYEMDLLSMEKPERLAEQYDAIRAQTDEAGIGWYTSPFHSSPPVLAKYLDWAKMMGRGRSLHRQRRYDIIHGRSYVPSMVGLNLKRETGVRFIFDMDGFWVDERVEGGIWKLSNPVYRLMYNHMRRKEQEMLRESDAVVTLTEAAREVVQGYEAVPADKQMAVVPCCADLDLFAYRPQDVADRAAARARFSLSADDLVMIYLGSLGTVYLLEEMLRFFKHVLAERPEAKFLVLSGHAPEEVKAAARAEGVPESALRISRVPFADVPEVLPVADFAVFFYKPSFSRKACSPTKLGEYMGAGLPVVCNRHTGDVAQVVQSHSAGIVLDDFTTEAYTDAAARLDELLSLDRRTIRRGAEAYYDLRGATRTYDALYASLLGTRPLAQMPANVASEG